MTYKDNKISDLIPDYCNNRMNTHDKADFERRLQEDNELLREYNDFRGFQKLYHQVDSSEPTPSDAIFDQVSRNIEARQTVKKTAPVQSSPLLKSIRSYWQQFREFTNVPWMLAAAQAVVIVLLLMPATQQNTYSTLSATQDTVTAEKICINVVFQPNALESDIRSLLHKIQGSISNGPSTEGRYLVSINNHADLDKTVQTLKLSKIVLFAEPVY
jgi:hypothetical protein